MDVSLRETGLGGIAGTLSGVKIADELRLAYGRLNGKKKAVFFERLRMRRTWNRKIS